MLSSNSSVRKADSFSAAHCTWVTQPGLDRTSKLSPVRAGRIARDARAKSRGLAISADGQRLLVANIMDDSVSMIDVASSRIVAEQGLRPGVIDSNRHGQPGSSYPHAVA
jgi:hypothetical protein